MLSSASVLIDEPYITYEDAVEFRLTYQGPLLGASRTDTRAYHKRDIRRALHPQLKELWRTNPLLREIGNREVMESRGRLISGTHYIDDTSANFIQGTLPILPLVTQEMELACGLDILFLRRDPPGSLVSAGDLHNRIKTLFDALRRPQSMDELAGDSGDDAPLYVLLEDDKLITRLSLTTDTLLNPDEQNRNVHLVIGVKIKPIRANIINMGFSV